MFPYDVIDNVHASFRLSISEISASEMWINSYRFSGLIRCNYRIVIASVHHGATLGAEAVYSLYGVN